MQRLRGITEVNSTLLTAEAEVQLDYMLLASTRLGSLINPDRSPMSSAVTPMAGFRPKRNSLHPRSRFERQ